MNKRYAVAVAVLIAGALIAAYLIDRRSGADGETDSESSVASAMDNQGELSTSVSGIVTLDDGLPFPGAKVSVGGVSTTTDEEGQFVVTDVIDGEVVITASADGMVNSGPLAARLPAQLKAGETLDGVELVLRRFGSISGRVVANGKPVEARLSALYAGDEFAIDGLATSGADGKFSVATVPPGRLRILVETDDHALTESREVDLRDAESVTGLVIDLSDAGIILGNVVDTQGNAIGAAEVYAMPAGAPRARLARTSPEGSFRYDNFPVGTARLRVVADGFEEEILEQVVVERGETTSIDVVMEPSGGAYGLVVSRSGEPVPGAFIVRPNTRTRPVRSGNDGRFNLPDAGTTGLVAVSPRHGSSPVVSPLPSGVTRLKLTAGGSIEGRVLGANNEPVQNFEIGVEAFEVDGPVPYGTRQIGTEQFLSSNGSFVFGPLRPGKYWLRASAGSYTPGSSSVVNVTANGTARGVEIKLTNGAVVRGAVTDDTGAPVARAVVQLFDPMSPFRPASARTDAAGRFTLRGVPPGRRSLRVAAKGYLTAVSAGLDVPDGGEAVRNVVLSRKKPGERFQFHGIGAVLRKKGDAVEIMNTMDGKPAATFGLQRGDRILAVDGEATTDMRLDNVVERIRGEEGAAVEIELEREGEGRFTVSVERGRVVVR